MTAKDLKNALLQEAVQGKLVPQIASEGNARDLLEKIRKSHTDLQIPTESAGKKKGDLRSKSQIRVTKKTNVLPEITEDEIPFDIPESWCWCRLGDISYKITDGEHKTPNRVNNFCGYYLLSARNILNGSISLDKVDYVDAAEYEKISKRCNPVKGDVLISCSGSVGRSAVVNDNNHYVMVRSAAMTRPIINDSFFIMYCIQSPCLQEQIQESIKQAVQANLFQEAIRNLLIPLPPLSEQKRIVAAIETFMPLIEEYGKKETVLNELNTQIGTLTKKAILQEAVQGKLVPPACRQAGKSPAKGLIKPEENWYFVYVIECKDGSFYKGFTENLEKRLEEHKRGIGADWTKTHGVKQLYYWEKVYTKEAAIKREKYLKSGIGREWFKKEVVEKPENWLDGHELLAKIRQQKQELIKEGNIKKEKPLPEITEDEIPCLPTGRPFDIPENWCWCRLGDVTSFNGGYAFKSEKYTSNGIRVLRISDFNETGIVNKSPVYYPKTLDLECYKIQDNDIVMCMTGGTVGKTYHFKKLEEEYYVNQRVADLKCSNLINDDYVYLVIQNSYIKRKIDEFKNSTNDNISADLIKSFVIPLPPLSEQKRIVEAIEKMLPLCEKLGK